MNTLLCAASLVLSATFGQVTNEDNVTLIRSDLSSNKQKVSIWSYKSDGPASDFVGVLNQSDQGVKGLRLSGKKPVRWAVPGDWDGDGIDELIAVRERKDLKDKRLEIRIHQAPNKIFDKVGGPVATSKKKDFGVAKGNGAVIAFGVLDYDGDGDDEVMVLRDFVFAKTLEIRNLPPGKSKPMGNPIASDLDFGGQSALEEVISMHGTDTNGDGRDEIVLHTRINGGQERILVYNAPISLFADAGAPFATFDNLNTPTGFHTSSVSRLYLDEPEAAEFMTLTRINDETGDQRISLHAYPTSVGATLGAPIRQDVTPGFVDASSLILNTFGLRRNPPPPPPPPPVINGNFEIFFEGVDPMMNPVEIGPFTGATAAVGGGGNTWTMNMQAGLTMIGTIEGVTDPPLIMNGTSITITAPVNATQAANNCGTIATFLVEAGQNDLSGTVVPGDSIVFGVPGTASVSATEQADLVEAFVGCGGGNGSDGNPCPTGCEAKTSGGTILATVNKIRFVRIP